MDELTWLITREIPHLRRFAIALTRDETLADDLVQDTLERALRKRWLWRRRGSLRSWLFRMLYRIQIDHNRSPWRRLIERSDGEAVGRRAEPARQEHYVECRDIADALAELGPEQRAAVLLVALEGMSYDQAADVLGIPIGTLRSRLSRARRRLQDLRTPTPERPRLRRVK